MSATYTFTGRCYSKSGNVEKYDGTLELTTNYGTLTEPSDISTAIDSIYNYSGTLTYDDEPIKDTTVTITSNYHDVSKIWTFDIAAASFKEYTVKIEISYVGDKFLLKDDSSSSKTYTVGTVSYVSGERNIYWQFNLIANFTIYMMNDGLKMETATCSTTVTLTNDGVKTNAIVLDYSSYSNIQYVTVNFMYLEIYFGENYSVNFSVTKTTT